MARSRAVENISYIAVDLHVQFAAFLIKESSLVPRGAAGTVRAVASLDGASLLERC
jgi:hypothetical protein